MHVVPVLLMDIPVLSSHAASCIELPDRMSCETADEVATYVNVLNVVVAVVQADVDYLASEDSFSQPFSNISWYVVETGCGIDTDVVLAKEIECPVHRVRVKKRFLSPSEDGSASVHHRELDDLVDDF